MEKKLTLSQALELAGQRAEGEDANVLVCCNNGKSDITVIKGDSDVIAQNIFTRIVGTSDAVSNNLVAIVASVTLNLMEQPTIYQDDLRKAFSEVLAVLDGKCRTIPFTPKHE